MTDEDKATPPTDSLPEEPGKREPAINVPLIVLAAILACASIHLVRIYVLTQEQDLALLVRAAFVPIRYTGGYDLDVYAFTSPVTYSLLHGSVTHLAVDMVWLAAFGSPLANRMGATRFLLFWIVSSVAAAGLHFANYPYGQSPLVGASGAISAMMGAAARFAFRIDRSAGQPTFAGPVLPVAYVLRLRGVIIFLAVWMVINLVTGVYSLTPGVADQIAWEAHIGGFLVGFLGLSLFDRASRDDR